MRIITYFLLVLLTFPLVSCEDDEELKTITIDIESLEIYQTERFYAKYLPYIDSTGNRIHHQGEHVKCTLGIYEYEVKILNFGANKGPEYACFELVSPKHLNLYGLPHNSYTFIDKNDPNIKMVNVKDDDLSFSTISDQEVEVNGIREPLNGYPPFAICGDICIPKTVVINNKIYNVTSIADSAFYGCSRLNIVVPENITFSVHSFDGCLSLTLPSAYGSTGEKEGYHFVDLGLSVKWATYNVGATNVGDVGHYFSWGETSPKSSYYKNNYKWYSADDKNSITKYCDTSQRGIKDNKHFLDSEDDAATANWGKSWRIPTYEELAELKNGCSWQLTERFGIAGMMGISNINGNEIFLPASGFYSGDYICGLGMYGDYWSSKVSLNTAFALFFSKVKLGWDGNEIKTIIRDSGNSVRAVTE